MAAVEEHYAVAGSGAVGDGTEFLLDVGRCGIAAGEGGDVVGLRLHYLLETLHILGAACEIVLQVLRMAVVGNACRKDECARRSSRTYRQGKHQRKNYT